MELGESKEDYLKAMYIIRQREGYIRNAMLCEYMNYSRASISIAIHTLCERGYVVRNEDGNIDLTEAGEEIARRMYERYEVLRKFLLLIGVPPKLADKDACRMEHAMSQETYMRIRQLVTER